MEKSGKKRFVRYLVFLLAVPPVLAVLCHLAFFLIVSTSSQMSMLRENRMYARTYPEMVARVRLLEDVIAGLEIKDAAVYMEIFHNAPPEIDPVNSLDILPSGDGIQDRHYVEYTAKKAVRLFAQVEKVEAAFAKTFEVYRSDDEHLPPLSLPLEDVSYAQIGASVGSRVNPFFKLPMNHTGLDIIAPQGTPVLATADGVVSGVVKSRKGQGNVVSISHKGGYETRYCHLGSISVKKGVRVLRGQEIGRVGLTGNAYATHLHYEVLKDGVCRDPVNYFFASLSPDQFANVRYMSNHTRQSMD